MNAAEAFAGRSLDASVVPLRAQSGGTAEARKIIGGVTRSDSSAEARGQRAHARVLAMIETAEQARIANLLAVAAMSRRESGSAYAEAVAALGLNTTRTDCRE